MTRQEDLEQALFRQLVHGLVELLVSGVDRAQLREALGGRCRDRREPHGAPGVQRVADGQLSGHDQADDVAGVGLGDGGPVAPEEPVHACEPEGRAVPYVHDHVLRQSPGATRRNATRSRCRGFMFAWILNTNPEKSGSSGCTSPESTGRGDGGGAK